MASSRRPRPQYCSQPGTIVVMLLSVPCRGGNVLLRHAGQDAPGGSAPSVMGASIASALAQRSGSGHRQSWRPAPAEELSGWTGNPLCRQRMRSAFEISPQGDIPGRVQVTEIVTFHRTHARKTVELSGLEPLTSCMPCRAILSAGIPGSLVPARQATCVVWLGLALAAKVWARSHLACHWFSVSAG